MAMMQLQKIRQVGHQEGIDAGTSKIVPTFDLGLDSEFMFRASLELAHVQIIYI